MNNLLPQSLQQPHLIAFDLLAKQRLKNIELDALLVYMIDSVQETALYYLAKQFDLMGFSGWKLADTTEKKRELIKKGIELHRYKGTVWAIREALRTVGFPNATITEHVGHWAGFSIQLNAGDIALEQSKIDDALMMVRAYKNVRSHLVGFEFKIELDSSLALDEDIYSGPADMVEDGLFLGSDFKYNGDQSYNGEKNYNSDEDILELTIK